MQSHPLSITPSTTPPSWSGSGLQTPSTQPSSSQELQTPAKQSYRPIPRSLPSSSPASSQALSPPTLPHPAAHLGDPSPPMPASQLQAHQSQPHVLQQHQAATQLHPDGSHAQHTTTLNQPQTHQASQPLSQATRPDARQQSYTPGALSQTGNWGSQVQPPLQSQPKWQPTETLPGPQPGPQPGQLSGHSQQPLPQQQQQFQQSQHQAQQQPQQQGQQRQAEPQRLSQQAGPAMHAGAMSRDGSSVQQQLAMQGHPAAAAGRQDHGQKRSHDAAFGQGDCHQAMRFSVQSD